MELFKASQQWANRPADERFWDLAEMEAAAVKAMKHGVVKEMPINRLRVAAHADGKGLGIVGSNKAEASFSHFSFSQLCSFIAPPDLIGEKITGEKRQQKRIDPECMKRFPANQVAEMVNFDLARCDRTSQILWESYGPGQTKARAFQTPDYSRIWNAEAIETLKMLQGNGWTVPPARPSGNETADRIRIATAADVSKNKNLGGGLSINIGDKIAPAGLYMGDKDMFAFLVNETRPINGGGKTPLFRGFFFENSEVGQKSYKIMTFLYNSVCGNHIVWGASKVSEVRVIHVGNASDRAANAIKVQLKEYSDASASDLELKIKNAKTIVFGKDKGEVVDTLYDRDMATRKALMAAFDAAVEHPEDGGDCDPRSAWGMAQGFTRMSQLQPYMDKRIELDRIAGRILNLATNSKDKALALA